MRFGYKKRHTAKVFIVPLLCLVVLLYGLHSCLKRAEPIFVAQTSNYSNTAFTDLVNKCILDIAKTSEFSDLFKVISQDGVTAIEADTSKINLITSQLLINIQNALNNDYPATLYIPLGSLTNYYLLSSMGPQIPVKIIPISIVKCKIKDDVNTVGINQVNHKVYLEIEVNMHYRGFALDEKENICATVPIAQTVISGDVPQYYGSDTVNIN